MQETLTQVIMYQGRKDDRSHRLLSRHRIDLPDGRLCLVNRIDKWQSDLVELMLVELGQQAVTKGFRRHPGLVRKKKDSATNHILYPFTLFMSGH